MLSSYLAFHPPLSGKIALPYSIFFICNKSLSSPGSLIADPFCGSGTVLLEALFASLNSVGIDSNPLERLISKVKTTAIDIARLESIVPDIINQCRRTDPGHAPDVVNLTYWFHPHAIHQLSKIIRAIHDIQYPEYKDFLSVCFSACVRKVSLADPRVSVPVRLRADRYPDGHKLRGTIQTHLQNLQAADCIEVFERIVYENMQRLAALEPFVPMQIRARIVGTDARDPRGIQPNSVDLVVTSPPYMGAQKYIRSSSLELGWLGLARSSELKILERRCLGREHFHKAEYRNLKKTGIPEADILIRKIFKINPLRACLAANYLNEMRTVLARLCQRIRSGGHLVLVCSNNSVCGHDFRTHEFLRHILNDLFLKERLRLVDTIRSRGLMTKRNKTASIISHEWILLFQKP